MDKVRNRTKYFSFFAAGLFIGGIIGVIVINLLVSYRIDNYIKEIEYLNTTIEDNNIKLEKLQDTIHKNKLIIKEIEVELKFQDEEDDEIARIALTKHIKEKFNDILGEEVDNINGDLLCEILDKRLMRLDGKEYQLRVARVVISQKIKFWIEVKTI